MELKLFFDDIKLYVLHKSWTRAPAKYNAVVIVALCITNLRLASHFLILSFLLSSIHLKTDFSLRLLTNSSTNCNPFHQSVTIMWVAHLLHTYLVLGSDIGLETNCPHLGFLWFPSVTLGKCWGWYCKIGCNHFRILQFIFFLWCHSQTQA